MDKNPTIDLARGMELLAEARDSRQWRGYDKLYEWLDANGDELFAKASEAEAAKREVAAFLETMANDREEWRQMIAAKESAERLAQQRLEALREEVIEPTPGLMRIEQRCRLCRARWPWSRTEQHAPGCLAALQPQEANDEQR